MFAPNDLTESIANAIAREGTGWGSVSLLKKLDTENYNVVVVSPRNYFLFTPLLPSCTTGLIEHRSIMEPIRNVLRQKKATVKFYEAEATKIDYERRVVYISEDSEWSKGRENVGKVLKEELRACESAMKHVEDQIGRRKLKDVMSFIDRVRKGDVVLEGNGAGGAGGFSAALLERGKLRSCYSDNN